MSFWTKLFGKKKKSRKLYDWEQIGLSSQDIDFHDEEQRSRYVMECIEQIAEADRETQRYTNEYSLVTSYLADMEELGSLPESEKKQLELNAKSILSLEEERKSYLGKKGRMSDADYQMLQNQEQTVEEGIEKLRSAEKYAGLIRQDLKKLDVERQAHDMRRQDLTAQCDNYRGMAVIFMAAFLLCMVLLCVLQFLLHMDARIGFFLAVLTGAVALSVLCLKFLDAQKELNKIRLAIGRLIRLQNRVKVRYVNNTNLLEYLRLKYNTESSAKLAKLWASYQKEREERQQFAEVQAKIEYYRDQLGNQLAGYHLKDPGRWLGQIIALVDPREMVEIRHDLIQRRQALRKQLEYNRQTADAANKEILDIEERYPAYREEILDMVNKYRRDSARSL